MPAQIVDNTKETIESYKESDSDEQYVSENELLLQTPETPNTSLGFSEDQPHSGVSARSDAQSNPSTGGGRLAHSNAIPAATFGVDYESSVQDGISTEETGGLLLNGFQLESALCAAIGNFSHLSPRTVSQLSLQWPVDEASKGRLLDAYLRETSTWCETTDTLRHFSTKCSFVLIESDCFLAAALALASRQLDITTNHPHSVSLELYQFTIRTLIERGSEALHSSTLASCVMLCVFEMMQSPVNEWRRHLQGCAQLFRARGWNGSSGGYAAACFWPFARIGM